MSNIVTDRIHNQEDFIPQENKDFLSQAQGECASAPLLAMSMTDVHWQTERCNVHAYLSAYVMDEDLLQEAWPSRKASNKRGEFNQRGRTIWGGSPRSKHHADSVDGGRRQNRQALCESKALLTRLNQRAQDSLVHQLENRLKLLQEQGEMLGHLLEKFEKLAKKLKEAWKSFQQLEGMNVIKFDTGYRSISTFQQLTGRNFNFETAKEYFLPLLSYLKEFYANDRKVLKRLDQLKGDESLSEKKLRAWNNRGCLYRLFSYCSLNSDGRAMNNFYGLARLVLEEMMEPVLRERLPHVNMNGVSQGMMYSQEGVADLMRIVHTQMLDILGMISILGEEGENAIFSAEALLMYLIQLALKNNGKKDRDQVKMMNMNMRIQEQNFKRAEKNLESIEASRRCQTAFKWISFAIMVIVCLAAVLSGQLWMAGLMAGFGLASTITVKGTNLPHLVTSGIGKLFEVMGLSEKWAKALADIVVVLALVALVVFIPSSAGVAVEAAGGVAVEAAGGVAVEGVAAGAAEAAAAGAAEAAAGGAEAAAGGAEAAAGGAEAAAGDANSGIFQKMLQRGGTMLQRVGTPMMVCGMSMNLTEFPTDIAKAATKKKGAQNIIAILLEILASVFAFVGGLGMLSSSGLGGSAVSRLTNGMRLGVLRSIEANAEGIALWAYRIMAFFMFLQGLIGVGQGINQLCAGTFKKEYEELAGNTAMISCAEDIVGQIVTNNQSDLKKLTKALALFSKNMDAASLASLGVARALAQSA